MEMGDAQSLLRDFGGALVLVTRRSWQSLLAAWILVPAGCVLILLACFGVNRLISLNTVVSFPASVACMISLFIALLCSELAVGEKRTRRLVQVIDVPAGFALRYINIFCCPSFVLLPLSPPIGGTEVGKIIAVFIVGYFVVFTATAYLTRGLQLIRGTSKRAMTERAEELGTEGDEIPLTHGRVNSEASEVPSLALSPPSPSSPLTAGRLPFVHFRTTDAAEISSTGRPLAGVAGLPDLPVRRQSFAQGALPLSRLQKWAAFVNIHLDAIIYTILFVFAGLPVYYATSYAMPAHLCLNIPAYFAASSIPTNWKRFLHPVLVSSTITVVCIWILALTRRESLQDGLHAYSTKTRYIQLWTNERGLKKPGAGDLLASVLDVSIVALALPMFQYRMELKRHFLSIFAPNISISIASLFGYPALCYAIGISSTRSLAFASRSLTLALAQPATVNLGGDLNTIAPIAIISGILGVLIGPQLLRWLRIPEDDYVTHGVTLGGNSSAIAAAMLLGTDPRAAALAILSMSLFGTITVALTSIPPIVRIVQGLV